MIGKADNCGTYTADMSAQYHFNNYVTYTNYVKKGENHGLQYFKLRSRCRRFDQ